MSTMVTTNVFLAILPNEPCDRCGAAGKLKVALAVGILVFCGHHANQFATELIKVAVDVVTRPDFTWRGLALLRDNQR